MVKPACTTQYQHAVQHICRVHQPRPYCQALALAQLLLLWPEQWLLALNHASNKDLLLGCCWSSSQFWLHWIGITPKHKHLCHCPCPPCWSKLSNTWFLLAMGSGISLNASIKARGWSNAAPAGPPPAPVGTSAGTVSSTHACTQHTAGQCGT